MNDSMKQLTKTAMMTAIIFVMTYMLKIPNPMTGGYTHLGDCGIFVAVMLLGKKRGALAGALGGMLSDFIGGYMVWVIPTFVIKGVMAYLMGMIVEKMMPRFKKAWILGAIVGGLFQIVAYTLVKIPLVGIKAAVASIFTISTQTLMGIVIAAVVITVLETSGAMKQLQRI